MLYKFSVTKDYVCKWGLNEAVREILQNAIDSSGEMVLNIDKDGGELEITSLGIVLPQSTLLLGQSSKRNDPNKVGLNGEGSLLALLVLARNGYEVTIYNGDNIWTPCFEYSEEFNTDIFCIKEESGDGEDLRYIIKGLQEWELENLVSEFPTLRQAITGEKYKSIKTNYGEIITDKEYSGKMFVNGLPIYSDDNFKYGYNFESKYVQLDRDRKSINIYELKRLTALAMTYMDEPDFDLLDRLIDDGKSDIDYLKGGYINLNNNFIDKYSAHLKDRFKIEDNSVVTTESKLFDEITNKSLDNENIKPVVVSKSIYADIINMRHTYSSSILSDVKSEMDERSDIDDAWNAYEYSSYKKLKEWLDENKCFLLEKPISEFKEILSSMEIDSFDLIRKEVWKDEQF